MIKNLFTRALILNSIPIRRIGITLCFTLVYFSSLLWRGAGSEAYSQAPNWLWATNAEGSNSDEGWSIAVDGSGSSYVTGDFGGSSITFGTTTLSNAGGADIFIVKYDACGNVVWAKSAGGSEIDDGRSIAIDGSGSSYVTGSFGSSSITFGTTTLINAGVDDIFIVKYDAVGNVVWAKSAGGSSFDDGRSIAVDGNGNSYITGFFRSPSITFGTTTLTNGGDDDIFIVKYDAGGNVVWAKSTGGNKRDYGNSIAVDGSGNSYVTGNFGSPSMTFGTTVLTNTGGEDIFIIKYDANGNFEWAKSPVGSKSDNGLSIAIDGSGGSYVTGSFASPSITFGTTTLINAGVDDIFIVKYDAGGNVVWAKSVGGSSGDDGISIAIDGNGNSYVSGCFASPTITFGTTTLTNAGNFDIFIVKYDAGGNVMWAKSTGGSNVEFGICVAVDGSGRSYVTGYSGSPSITFGTTTLSKENSNYHMFVAKLANTITEVEEPEDDTGISMFPNPASNELTISLPVRQAENLQLTIQYIEIYDALGQCVITQQPIIKSEKHLIDVSKLSTGIYFVKLNNGEKFYCKKIIIKRD